MLTVISQSHEKIPEGWGVIAAEQLITEIAENPELIVVDVRAQVDVDDAGVIDAPIVIHVPLGRSVQRQADGPPDTDTPIVIYCGSDHRSTMALTMMWTYGYEDVRSLKGGFGLSFFF